MKRALLTKTLPLLLVLSTAHVFSFVDQSHCCRRTMHTYSASLSDDSCSQTLDLNLLAFPASEILFPGQSSCFILKEGRFFDLVDDATSSHDSVIGMLLMGDDGIFMDGLPLCKIKDIDVRSGYRGKITMSIELQAVGRARLKELKQIQPTFVGSCLEFHDEPQTSNEDLQQSQKLIDHLAGILGETMESATYPETYADAIDVLEAKDASPGSVDLAAQSWAFMACLSPESIERYGPHAIATNDICQRLDIVTKAFLEEQILLTKEENITSIMENNIDGFE